jgi:hypothetical protein
MKIKTERANGRELFYELLGMDTSKMSEFERIGSLFPGLLNPAVILKKRSPNDLQSLQ